MTTYVYETIPQKPGEKSEYFELQQSMQDPALSLHPTTGQPVRRVILGGYGVLKVGAATPPAARGDCGCSPGSCCN
jgi:predicted nucleic acid-binding Zn ribbon protein